MALVYAAMGVVAALLGANLQAWLQDPWLLGSLCGDCSCCWRCRCSASSVQLPVALRDRLDHARATVTAAA
jgi:thiol:disulfide interchange protein DsbD